MVKINPSQTIHKILEEKKLESKMLNDYWIIQSRKSNMRSYNVDIFGYLQVLEMKYRIPMELQLQGYNYYKIHILLDIPEGTVKTLIYQGRIKLIDIQEFGLYK